MAVLGWIAFVLAIVVVLALVGALVMGFGSMLHDDPNKR